jgi:hypothetical protein
MPKSYSEKEFQKDLMELEYLIKNSNKQNKKNKSMKGGKNNNNENNNNMKGGKNNEEYFEEDEEDDYDDQEGGKIEDSDKLRSFTVCHLHGKELKEEIGDVKIKVGRTPLAAARKLFSSIANNHDLKGNALHNFKATFSIREKTRGSKTHNKVYGPYHGKYLKEKKDVKLKSGKVIHYGKVAEVKLAKHHVSNQKGGK